LKRDCLVTGTLYSTLKRAKIGTSDMATDNRAGENGDCILKRSPVDLTERLSERQNEPKRD